MGIDLESVYAIQKDLKRASDDVSESKHRLAVYQNDMQCAWRSGDSRSVQAVVSELERYMQKASEELMELGRLIVITGEEICEEEAAAEADMHLGQKGSAVNDGH